VGPQTTRADALSGSPQLRRRRSLALWSFTASLPWESFVEADGREDSDSAARPGAGTRTDGMATNQTKVSLAVIDEPLGTPAEAPFPGMIWVAGGTYRMGSDRHYPDEAPAHDVTVDGFWMDETAVTNAEFRRFVEATGYVTSAERPPNPDDYPGAKPEMLVPASIVFQRPAFRVDLRNHFNWWAYVSGADWRHPRGPDSTIEGMDDHPVVHVAYHDAAAYSRWAGKALPTEAEWERAARGGLEGAEFVWGDELAPGGKHLANTWQGEFPLENLLSDGFEWTAPVRSYAPNGFGLYEMAGNVWEWTMDFYEARHRVPGGCCSALKNPRGGVREKSTDPCIPNSFIPRKVIKGGSFLCAPNYCQRYRPAARMAQPIDTSTCHLGLRCIVRPDLKTAGT
jgi:formylglycine-generating enzyme required for sulfatase activity